MFKKSLFLLSALGVSSLSLSAIAEPVAPAAKINHNDCAEHLIYLVQGINDAGIGRRNTTKILKDAKKFDPKVNGYTVDEKTAAWSNQYNPIAYGGADANWVDELYGPDHPSNKAFFTNGKYGTKHLKKPEEIKKAVLAMTQKEIDALPSIRKYDIMTGDWNMTATVEQIKYFGVERKPKAEGWEGFCYPMRFIGATCPVPTKVVARDIPGSNKKVNFSPYDVATIAAAHWNGTSLYARMGSVNRAARDLEPPNAGAYHIMLQSYKTMKEKFPDAPFAATHDVEPNPQLWNEALQNWESEYSEVAELSAEQIRKWKAPRGSKKFVDVDTTVQLTEEAGVTNELTRQTVVDGDGLNTLVYPYRLYLDSNDEIIGGAWLKDQGRSYPDLVGFANGEGIGTDSLAHELVVELLRDSTEEVNRVIPGT